jgi:hypothetical protein
MVFIVSASACYENPHSGPHLCESCLPCEDCVSGTNGPICQAFSHEEIVCGEDGNTHWLDSCGTDEGVAEVCLNEQAVCTEIVSGEAFCECTNHWQGEGCTECPANWDPDQECAACLPHWFGEGCSACEDNWDIETGCTACVGNRDETTNCATCENHWIDEGNDCGTCPLHWDPFEDCDDCLPNWSLADECNSCIGNWDLETDCTACTNHWIDLDDDCGTCLPGWEGVDCDMTDPDVACPANTGPPCLCNGAVCDDGSMCIHLAATSAWGHVYGYCGEDCTDDQECSDTGYDATNYCMIVDDIDDPEWWKCLLGDCWETSDCPDFMDCYVGGDVGMTFCYPTE